MFYILNYNLILIWLVGWLHLFILATYIVHIIYCSPLQSKLLFYFIIQDYLICELIICYTSYAVSIYFSISLKKNICT